jgi:uncharacterized protein involved in exopolysaccharide biosynthesis
VIKLRAEQAQSAEERNRLAAEIDALRGRLADAESMNAELSMLRDERDVIRTRVTDMLSHLEGVAI